MYGEIRNNLILPTMEKRIHKRIYIHETAYITVNEKAFNGYIVNVSEGGIGFMITSFLHMSDDTLGSSSVELTFDIPSGKREHLQCEVLWTRKGLYTDNTIALGMKITAASTDYSDWIKKLLISNSSG